ncbi:MAG: M3 family metallopeptidase [Candidatus Krumholzibacteria bacterium]|nr:M3 family metallopeptidase [Candidatus Krumholzibacteria bacterium]
MRSNIVRSAALVLVLATTATATDNPFFSSYDTPFGVPPFDRIEVAHYMPAFDEGMKRQSAEVDAIVNDPAPPNFINTVEALEASGQLLTDVSYVFFNLNSANTNDEMQAIAKEVAPLLSKHQDDILLNEQLFARVKAVYDQREDLGLTPEQRRLLDEHYKAFVRGGANLDEESKTRFREINERLSVLSVQFGENVLAEDNAFEMVIEDEEDLAGLPTAAVQAAAEAAATRGHEGKWVFTLHKPSMIPFLTYGERRDLREKIFKAYINRGNNGDEHDNKAMLAEMVALRAERAGLLGFETHADYVLDENMARKPEKVYALLDKLWKPALARAKQEAAQLQAMIDEEGGGFQLEAWDWWYYAERVKKAKYDFDDEALRPYFQLENVRKGAFEVATRLFGITFEERFDIPKYHEDVRTFEVKDADGSHIGIYYVDYHPRESKRGGAWMSEYRQQSRMGGKEVTPIICNVSNVSKATADTPALLSLDETATLFHEFGHGLHGLLSDCTFPTLAGTNVPRDFVEMPSQVLENWATEPEVLALYARHYKTGEPMPQELIDKMKNARLFNQGFATVEYLAASYLDMDWHTLKEPRTLDPVAFENESLKRIGLMDEIVVRYKSPYFRHIFAGGYSAGYYSYIWAEVLDADAFEVFKQNGIFDRETAMRFRKHILATGSTDDPMVLYRRFRGADPSIEPLLVRRGLSGTL